MTMTAKFPVQVVVMQTMPRGIELLTFAKRYGLGLAPTVRIMQEIAAPLFEEEMRRRGEKPMMGVKKATELAEAHVKAKPRRAGPRAGARKSTPAPRRSTKRAIPPAQFQAPATASV